VNRRLPHGGLRAQLAVAIALVTLLAVGASFVALYGRTGSRLRGELDTQLRTQATDWRRFIAGAKLNTPAAVERAAARFIAAQGYHADHGKACQ